MSDLIRRAVLGAVLATVSLIAVGPAAAQSRTGGAPNTMFAGIGLKGYDPVSYFTDAAAAEGSADITAEANSLTWRFVSAEHKAAFVADPAKYMPQYGGFCSWGVSQGRLFDVDPVNGWTISEGKLYVNFNADINATFAADPAAYIAKADVNWPELNK
jgi:YHS domain-containing protein